MPRAEIGSQRLEGYIYRQLENAIAFLGLTQQQAGRAIGISQSGFSQAINGKTLTVKQMCDLLDEMGLTICIESK